MKTHYAVYGDWKPGMTNSKGEPLVGRLDVTGPENGLTKKKAEARLAQAVSNNWYPDLVNLRVAPIEVGR